MKKDVCGFLFPVPHRFVERLIPGKRDVFVKFGRYRFLSSGDKMVFYDPGVHMIVGEAKIKQVTSADPSTIWRKYGPRIFLQEYEFNEYVARSPLGPRSQKRNIMTAFIVEKPRKYSKPRKPPKRVTPSGYYLLVTSS